MTTDEMILFLEAKEADYGHVKYGDVEWPISELHNKIPASNAVWTYQEPGIFTSPGLPTIIPIKRNLAKQISLQLIVAYIILLFLRFLISMSGIK